MNQLGLAVLTRVEPNGGSLTAWPHEVGIIMRDGKITEVFSEDKRSISSGLFRRGEVRAYIASTKPFRLEFWLKDPDDPDEPDADIALDRPVLTSDGQFVTGWIGMTFSVVSDRVDLLLRLLGRSDTIGKFDVAHAIKGELLAKVLALDLHKHTSDGLRGNEGLFRSIYASLNRELASTICGYGLRLNNFDVTWGLTLEEKDRIRRRRHGNGGDGGPGPDENPRSYWLNHDSTRVTLHKGTCGHVRWAKKPKWEDFPNEKDARASTRSKIHNCQDCMG